MRKYLVVAARCCVLLLSGCSTINGHYASMPTNMPDGLGTYRFEHTYKIFSGMTPNIVEYRGQWVANRPEGQGQVFIEGIDLSCKGEFGVIPSDVNLRQFVLQDIVREDKIVEAWAKGDIYRDNGTRLIYSGYFNNRFDMGLACSPGGEGTKILNDWKVTGTFKGFGGPFGGFMKSGSCKIEKNSGEIYIGNCSPPPGVKLTDGFFVWKWDRASTVEFSLAAGPGIFIDAAGTRYEGDIKRGAVLDGLYTAMPKQRAPTLALFSNNKIVMEHPSPEVIAKQGKACGPSNWRLLNGDCVGNKWSGAVDAYTVDGMRHVSGEFKNGALVGKATFATLAAGGAIIGQLEIPIADDISFTHGVIKVGNIVAYDGEMSGLNPNGKGMCRVDGALEACEFAEGYRVDTLYKTRIENRKLLAAMEDQKQAQNQAEERRQAAARNSEASAQESDSGSTMRGLLTIVQMTASNYNSAMVAKTGGAVGVAQQTGQVIYSGASSTHGGAKGYECGAMGAVCPSSGSDARVSPGYKDALTANWEIELARPKYVDSSAAAPGGPEATEAAARTSALQSWEGTKGSIESAHNNHVRYGRIVSVGSPICSPQHNGNGDIREWSCIVYYSVERARQGATSGGVISK